MAFLQSADGDDRDPEFGFQSCGVEDVSRAVDGVDHVQGDDDRDIDFKQLGRQIQVPFEVGGVDHVNDAVGLVV